MKVRYAGAGSPEHKRYPYAGSRPGLRADKSECPPEVRADDVPGILETRIPEQVRLGICSPHASDVPPRYVWGRDSFPTSEAGDIEIVWEARLTNVTAGEYKAFSISRRRHAEGVTPAIEDHLWPIADENDS